MTLVGDVDFRPDLYTYHRRPGTRPHLEALEPLTRKFIALFVAGAVFFGSTLAAAASPLENASASSFYTENTGTAVDGAEPAALPVIGAFALGVAVGVAGNALYDWTGLDQLDSDRITQGAALTPAAEGVFDN